MLNSSSWLFNSPAFYNGIATQSLRYNDDDSPYLQRTFSGGDQQSWTWSGWVKRGSLGQQNLFGTEQDGSNIGRIEFRSDHKIKVNNKTGNTNGDECQTLAVYRDVSAWYHIVVSFDGSQSTQANRTKIYVNGILQDKQTDLSLSAGNGLINSNKQHAVGARGVNLNTHFDGYMAEVNFVDGQTLDETDFGEFKNGVWIAKAYTGSYGTNGFRLQFNQTGTGTASSSTIGADTSGNDNHWTSSGIVASDCDMPDSPENNFATFNSVDPSNPTFSEGNLKVAFSGSGKGSSRSTIGVASGKWYAEFYQVTVGNGVAVGAVGEDANLTAWVNIVDGSVYVSVGFKNINGTESSYGTGYSDGDIIGVALDMDAGSITLYLNNSSQGVMNTGLSGEHFISFSDGSGATSGTAIANFGQDSSFVGVKTAQGNTDENGIGDFYYSPPSGYLALCTANLPEPTISPNADTQADDYFNTVLYTGNGTGQSITGVGFQADWIWQKERSNNTGGGNFHYLSDSVRGVNAILQSNTAGAESTGTDVGINSFDSDGFTMGTYGGGNANQSGETYVAWNWKANGSPVINTAGTITSQVSANTDAGFSIVSYTGNGTLGATIGHGLSQAPAMIIVKNRTNGYDWTVYHQSIGASGGIYLSLTNSAVTGYSLFWDDTAPTSTVVTLGTNSNVNRNGDNLIAYCFAEIESYSKFGSYTGNGSADGTFVYLGFRPAFVMVKRTDAADSWAMFDGERDIDNSVDALLRAEGSNAEASLTALVSNPFGDFLSNGFKIRNTSTIDNTSSASYIYMAFAEAPFKYSTAR